MRKLKPGKVLSLRKKTILKVDEDIFFPIRTLSLSEEASIKLRLPITLPSKITVPTQGQKEEFISLDPNFKPDVYIATKVFDQTSPQYIAAKSKQNSLEPMLDTLRYIDFNRKIKDEDGNLVAFYQHLGLSAPDDWLEICEYFEEAGFHEGHASQILVEVKKLKGDTIFERIARLQEITKMEYIDLIGALEKVVDQSEQSALENEISTLENMLKRLSAEELSEIVDEDGNISIQKVEDVVSATEAKIEAVKQETKE